nr:MAG TPA: hypothetical protein [Caudoviricetes sp.]
MSYQYFPSLCYYYFFAFFIFCWLKIGNNLVTF